MTQKVGGLGKGLDALFGERLGGSVAGEGPAEIELDKIITNPNQPRKTFDAAALTELADTIKKNGVLQPILVREEKNGEFTIIAGERRTRAARLAGLAKIPAIIKKFSLEQEFLVSILENLQREDLNPIEEAEAFKQLMEVGGLNQDALAAKVGKNRATIANALRLLKLPPAIQEALKKGTITAGHARALLSVEDTVKRLALFEEIISNTFSVRDAERRAAELTKGASVGIMASGFDRGQEAAAAPKNAAPPPVKRDLELVNIEERFIKALGTKVKIDGGFSGGIIKIEYFSMDDLNRLYDIFIGE